MARYYSRVNPRKSFGSGTKSIVDIVTVFGRSREDSGDRPLAEVSVHHTPPRELPKFNESEEFETSPHVYNEMFHHVPGKTEFMGAFAHSKLRSTVPVVAAYFHNKYGDLTASDDLSKYSSKLVKHAKTLGLPVSAHRDNPEAKTTNTYSFDDDTYTGTYSRLEHGSEIPKHKVVEAKEHLREMMGYKKPMPRQHIGPQFTQPQLPGMES